MGGTSQTVPAPDHLAGYFRAGEPWSSGVPDDAIRLAWARPGADLSIRIWQFGDLDVALYGADSAVEVVPGERPIPAPPGLAIGMCLSGRVSVHQAGRTVLLQPGEFTFYRGGEDFRITAGGPHSWLVVRLRFLRSGPRMLDLDPLLAAEFPLAGSLAGLLATALGTVPMMGDRLDMGARLHCADAIRSLAAAVIDEAMAADHAEESRSLFAAMGQWLEERLHEERLTAERLGAAHHVSARTVRKLFARNGTTVTTVVRNRRLERLRQDLLDPGNDHRTVAAIARRWGMSDVSSTTTAFRSCYGVPPATYRRLALAVRVTEPA